MDNLVARINTRVRTFITRHHLIAPGERVIVAVSGGVDSLVLLHILNALRDSLDLRLHVATLDHGIRGEAGAADAAFVCTLAEAWGLPVSAAQVDVPAQARDTGRGIEAAARIARYTFLEQVARSTNAHTIASGHNRDDQAETVLLHLIRGSGLDGLRGMLPSAPLHLPHIPDESMAPITIIRPLLDVSRAEIAAYAAAHDLAPREDATNRDLNYARNRLRHAIIPSLEALNPNLKATLARTAEILRADADLMAQIGEEALARVQVDVRENTVILDRAAWESLRLAEKRAVIRASVRRLLRESSDLAFDHIESAIRVADAGPTGAAATLPVGLMLRVDHTVLTLSPAEHAIIRVDAPALTPGDPALTFMAGDTIRHMFDGWLFEAYPLPAGADLAGIHADPLAAALAIPAHTRLRLRTRQPGDRIRPRGMGGKSQKLADMFTNMHVPLVWRDRVPLLIAGDDIVWVVAPTAEWREGKEGRETVRGRVADSCAIHAPHEQEILVVRWSKSMTTQHEL